MGFFDKLFSPSKTESTSKSKSKSTTVTDPYKGMPKWLADSFKSDVKFRTDLLDDASAVAEDMGNNPREVLGVDPYETAGLKVGQGGFDEAADLAGRGQDALAGLGDFEESYLDPATGYVTQSDQWGDKAGAKVGDIEGSIAKGQGFINDSLGNSGQAAGFMGDTTQSDQAAAFANDTTASDAAMKAAGYDMDALRSKYTSDYTGDVVDTTLAGMTRAADRERLARESAAAGVGGTSNTRTAVANAVSQQLTGLNMAEQEAKLRDAAFNNAVSGAQGEAKLELDRAKAYDTFANTGLSRGSLLDDLANTGITRAKGFDTLANTDLSRASAQGGITDDQLATGDYMRGLGADELDRSKAMLDIGELDLDKTMKEAGGWESFSKLAADLGMDEATLLANYGALNRGLKQEGKDAAHNAKKESLGWLGDMFTGTSVNKGPTGGTVTSKTKGKDTNVTPGPSPLQQGVGAATTAAGVIYGSDERIKQDISPVEGGLAAVREIGAFDYHYRPGYGHVEGPTRGLMAQHVGHIPGAQVRLSDGYLGVDPYPVLATVVKAVQELDRQANPAMHQTQAGLEAA